MENCVAFEEMVDSLNYRLQAERFQSILSYGQSLPTVDPFTAAYNEAMLRRAWYLRVASFILLAADPSLADLLFEGITYTAATDEYNAILEAVDMLDTDNVLGEYEYQGALAPAEIAAVADAYASERNQDNMRRLMTVWGIDTFTELALVVQKPSGSLLGGKVTYILPVRFVQFDGLWLADPNGSTLGSLLGLNVTAFAMEMP
jgi:hypothetical protein